MIYNLRGTNGSGKSHCVHMMLEKHEQQDLLDPTREGDAWQQTVGLLVPDLNLRTVGIYDMQCGGCDWFIAHRGNTDQLESLINRLAMDWVPQKHVLYEGFMVSGTFGRWNNQAQQLANLYGREVVHFLFLDTPVEVCIERILARRAKKLKPGQKLAPFNDKNCRDLHRQNLNNQENFRKAGRRVTVLDHRTAPEDFYAIVKEGR